MNVDDGVGIAHDTPSGPSRPGAGIAVLHRLVRPGQLERADVDVADRSTGAQRRREDVRAA